MLNFASSAAAGSITSVHPLSTFCPHSIHPLSNLSRMNHMFLGLKSALLTSDSVVQNYLRRFVCAWCWLLHAICWSVCYERPQFYSNLNLRNSTPLTSYWWHRIWIGDMIWNMCANFHAISRTRKKYLKVWQRYFAKFGAFRKSQANHKVHLWQWHFINNERKSLWYWKYGTTNIILFTSSVKCEGSKTEQIFDIGTSRIIMYHDQASCMKMDSPASTSRIDGIIMLFDYHHVTHVRVFMMALLWDRGSEWRGSTRVAKLAAISECPLENETNTAHEI